MAGGWSRAQAVGLCETLWRAGIGLSPAPLAGGGALRRAGGDADVGGVGGAIAVSLSGAAAHAHRSGGAARLRAGVGMADAAPLSPARKRGPGAADRPSGRVARRGAGRGARFRGHAARRGAPAGADVRRRLAGLPCGRRGRGAVWLGGDGAVAGARAGGGAAVAGRCAARALCGGRGDPPRLSRARARSPCARGGGVGIAGVRLHGAVLRGGGDGGKAAGRRGG